MKTTTKYVCNLNGYYRFFPELHCLIVKYEVEDWDKDISWCCRGITIDEHGIEYLVWFDINTEGRMVWTEKGVYINV